MARPRIRLLAAWILAVAVGVASGDMRLVYPAPRTQDAALMVVRSLAILFERH